VPRENKATQQHTGRHYSKWAIEGSSGEGGIDEDEASGGDEDYRMRGVGLIHGARPPWLLYKLNAFDRPDPRPA